MDHYRDTFQTFDKGKNYSQNCDFALQGFECSRLSFQVFALSIFASVTVSASKPQRGGGMTGAGEELS